MIESQPEHLQDTIMAVGTAANPAITGSSGTDKLSCLVITLLKGVIYHESAPDLWSALLKLQPRVREYVSVIGLELVLDESEGYCFLRSRQSIDAEDDASIPRLMARRQLSFPVSLLLALLRKRLAEFDARGGDTRLVLTLEEIVDLIRVFLPSGSNDTKLINQVETHINKIVELGFLKKMKAQSISDNRFEVRRILKAFVDAQWLADFDARLEQYHTRLAGNIGEASDD